MFLFGAVGHIAAAAERDGGAASDAGSADGGSSNDASDESKKADDKLVPTPAPPLPELADDGGRGLRVIVLPISGTIDLGLAPFTRRVLQEAQGAALVVLDVDTFGGRVDAAVKIRDALLATKVPTLAFVNRRAISAGALISLACDYIVFTNGASMGAATPIQIPGGEAKAVGEKMVSYMRSEMRATAEAKKRRGDVAEAMVDADVVIPGVSKKGKLLTVATELALKIGIANGQHDSLDELLDALGLKSAQVVHPATNWAEKIARILTDPVLSGLLMSLGFLGLLMELYTPGFGFAGGLGLVCLALFFGGHMVVDLAGWEEILLFTLGVAALAVEVFVIPGFGVVGIIGFALIAASLVMAMVGMPLDTSWDSGLLTSATGTVMLSLFATAVLLGIAVKFLPRQKFGRFLVLETTLAPGRIESDLESDEQPLASRWQDLVGHTGVALTDLRPAGKVRVGDQVLDVVSELEYIESGSRVTVQAVHGFRIVVIRTTGEVS